MKTSSKAAIIALGAVLTANAHYRGIEPHPTLGNAPILAATGGVVSGLILASERIAEILHALTGSGSLTADSEGAYITSGEHRAPILPILMDIMFDEDGDVTDTFIGLLRGAASLLPAVTSVDAAQRIAGTGVDFLQNPHIGGRLLVPLLQSTANGLPYSANEGQYTALLNPDVAAAVRAAFVDPQAA